MSRDNMEFDRPLPFFVMNWQDKETNVVDVDLVGFIGDMKLSFSF